MSYHHAIWESAIAILTLWAAHSLWTLHKTSKSIAHLPCGGWLYIDPFRSLAVVLGPIFPRVGRIGCYSGKFSVYEKYGSTCLSSIRVWNSQVYYWLSDADALKSVTSDRHTFQKDVEAYEPLNIYGNNIVGAEGADWKRYRGVAKPAFNDANIALVWSETIRVVNEWFSHLEGTRASGSKSQDIPLEVVPAMIQVTLLVLSAAGFGRSVSWSSDSSNAPLGHKLTFRDALVFTVDNIFVKILTPKWLILFASYIPVPYLSRRLEDTETAFEELRSHIMEMVSDMRADLIHGVDDNIHSGLNAALLRNLVEATMVRGGDNKQLTDDELLANIFTYLLAGYETSSHALSFAIALLALYPDAQRKIFDEVSHIWPSGCPTVNSNSSYKEDSSKLEYTTAFFRETIRHFPAVPRLAKKVCADTTLMARRFRPHTSGLGTQSEVQSYTVAMPKDSIVIMDVWATNMNPLHWGEDAAEFKPDRFIDTDAYHWPRDALLSFSAGPRGCIGSRFAMTENVCMLSLLVRQYEILVPSEMEGLSWVEQKETLLQWTTGATLMPADSRVRLKRRS